MCACGQVGPDSFLADPFLAIPTGPPGIAGPPIGILLLLSTTKYDAQSWGYVDGRLPSFCSSSTLSAASNFVQESIPAVICVEHWMVSQQKGKVFPHRGDLIIHNDNSAAQLQ